jgi:hypothetical protein
MGSATFKLDKKGVGALLVSPGMAAGVTVYAARIQRRAQAIAPVGTDPRREVPGAYRDGIVVTATLKGGAKRDRAAANVTATMPYSRDVEYRRHADGTAHHTILRAAQSAAAT